MKLGMYLVYATALVTLGLAQGPARNAWGVGATDRIYRLMIAQRIRHRAVVAVTGEDGVPLSHTPELLVALYDAELARLISEKSLGQGGGSEATLREARILSEEMIHQGWFDPV